MKFRRILIILEDDITTRDDVEIVVDSLAEIQDLLAEELAEFDPDGGLEIVQILTPIEGSDFTQMYFGKGQG